MVLNLKTRSDIAKELGDYVFFPGPVDVSSEAAVKEGLEKVTAEFPLISGLVNCGGILGMARTAVKGSDEETMSFELFHRVLQFAKWMATHNDPDEAGERGVIINTSSIAYQDGQTGYTAYVQAKAVSLP
ncbi:hypothetical protein BZG36_04269 [Bifiguratus adelaidae]|uniref:3-hydroxyacyl-CoA dehydrogenase type-2 n=1 Tax=Bifiguratus adelaidae TaxID=1938954 RepID=A0A261XWR6_9FUNG|nr:hypothetical protein BZG36_04269 [Bifiguratus adelaidae]